MSSSIQDTSNRRKSNRRPVHGNNAFAVLATEKEKIPVLIINESVSGIGVVAVNAPELTSGTIVEFESPIRRTESRVASVKYVRFADAVVCRIGLEWVD